tara:strand:+ start:286 stop:609 length:324 start_codon:yes stop_codon:yes gene_type:complete
MIYKIDKSKIHGYGIIAIQPIPENTNIGISHIGIGLINNKLVCGDITEMGSFTNHSYKPNCIYKVVDGNIHMVSIKDIDIEEELVIDFSKNKDIAVNIQYIVEDNWK